MTAPRLRTAPVTTAPAAALTPVRADAATAGAVRVDAGGAGLVLGRDADGGLVTVPMFRPEPTLVLVVGGLPLVQLLAFRSLALGARLVVETSRPAAWQAFAQLAGGATRSVTVVGPGSPDRAAGPTSPQLLVVDTDTGGDSRRLPAWSAQLAVVESISQWNAASVGSADVLVAQGLLPAQARVVGRTMNLPDAEQALSGLPEDVVALAGRGGTAAAQVRPTSVEQWLLAASGRR